MVFINLLWPLQMHIVPSWNLEATLTKMMENLILKYYHGLYYNQNPCLSRNIIGLTDTLFLWPLLLGTEPGWKLENEYLTKTALLAKVTSTYLFYKFIIKNQIRLSICSYKNSYKSVLAERNNNFLLTLLGLGLIKINTVLANINNPRPSLILNN